MRTIRLNIDKVASRSTLSREFLEDCELDSLIDVVTGDLALRLYKYVACSPAKRLKTKYPASTWQHFKQDYLPDWFISRYPIKYKFQYFDVKEVFPEYTNLRKNGGHLHVVEQTRLDIVDCLQANRPSSQP